MISVIPLHILRRWVEWRLRDPFQLIGHSLQFIEDKLSILGITQENYRKERLLGGSILETWELKILIDTFENHWNGEDIWDETLECILCLFSREKEPSEYFKKLCLPVEIQLPYDEDDEDGLDPLRTFPDQFVIDAVDRQAGRCLACRTVFDEIQKPVGHHFKAHSLKGKTVAENCAAFCARCNRECGNGDTVDFIHRTVLKYHGGRSL